MKSRISSLQSLTGASLLITALSAVTLLAEPAAQSTVQSVFIMPANPSEGHDPFFPDSIRPYSSAVTTTTHTEDVASVLKVKGITRMGDDYFVIIGNHTYGKGDEGDVKTSQGLVHIRVVKITANSAVVEVNGRFQVLPFSDNP